MKAIISLTCIILLSLLTLKAQQMTDTLFIQTEDNVKLYVETFGDSSNETCLFISGAGANSSFWTQRLCDSLVQKGFFVIKYDHRDFGYSSKINWEEQPYDIIQLVNDAIAILDFLEVDKAHVVGHSMGGFITQLFGIHFPERCLSITSISASTNSPDVPMPPSETWEIFLSNKPQNDFEKDLPGFVEVWKYLNGTATFDQEIAIEYTKNIYNRQDVDGALGATHVKAQASLTDRTEELKKVEIPALVMHGEEDYLVDKYGGIQTAEVIPNAKLVLIPKMGHIPFNHEILKRFENEIIQFVLAQRKSNSTQVKIKKKTISYFEFDNKKVYYKIKGEGEPLILLHGNTVSSRMFNTVLKKYVQNFQVIMIDFPGHGKSDRLEKFETDFWYYNSKVTYALIEELGLDKVSVIGTSGGALVGINLALEHPEKIKFLVADSFEGEYPLPSYINSIEADRKRDKKKLLAKLFWRYCHGRDWEKIVDMDTEVNIAFAKTGKSFFHKSIAELNVPALLTGSKMDEYCDHLDEIYTELKRKNNSLEIHLFEKGNHPAMISNKKEFFEIIKRKIL